MKQSQAKRCGQPTSARCSPDSGIQARRQWVERLYACSETACPTLAARLQDSGRVSGNVRHRPKLRIPTRLQKEVEFRRIPAGYQVAKEGRECYSWGCGQLGVRAHAQLAQPDLRQRLSLADSGPPLFSVWPPCSPEAEHRGLFKARARQYHVWFIRHHSIISFTLIIA